MKRLLITATALTLLGAPAAFAQQDQDHHDHGQHQGGGQQQGRGDNGGQQQGGHQQGGGATTQGQGRPGGGGQPSGGGRPDWNAYYRNNPDLQRAYRQNQQSPSYHESVEAFAQRHYEEHGRTEGRALPTIQGGGQQDQWREGRWQGRGGEDRYQGQDRYRGDGDRDNRWQRYERNTYAQHRFRVPEYRWPRGFSYRRWTYGEFLPQIFFGEDYWIYDYSDYGLPYPPPGAAWVRYGPDALLIDRYTGQIIQVIYGVFY